MLKGSKRKLVNALLCVIRLLTGCLIKWGVTFTARAGLGGVYCEKCTGQQITVIGDCKSENNKTKSIAKVIWTQVLKSKSLMPGRDHISG